jgi:hypothetical protein
VAPAPALLLLSPWVAEYLLGLQTPRDLPLIVFLVPMYGGGALLVREVTRRAGRGWPTMLLLAAAYGVLEAGVIDQSLWNSDYSGYDFQTVAHVPGIDVSAYYLLVFVSGHVIYSIGTPIAVVEAWTPHRAGQPWLRLPGLCATVGLYLLGAFIIWNDVRETEGGFQGSPLQLGSAAVVAVLLVVAAFAVPRRDVVRPARPRRPVVTGTAAFVAASAIVALHGSWFGVAYGALLLAAAAYAVGRWSRSAGWTPRHRVALIGAALLTDAWGAFVLKPWRAASPAMDLASDVTWALVAVLLVVLTVRRQIAQESSSQVGASAEPGVEAGDGVSVVSGDRSPQA